MKKTFEGSFYKLQWVIFIRLAVVTVMLGVAAFVHSKSAESIVEKPITYLYGLIALTYLVTILFSVLLLETKRLALLNYLQILWDSIFITTVIYLTGGVDSIFSFLYIISILNASILMFKKGALIGSAISSLFYGTLLILQGMGKINPFFSLERNIRFIDYFYVFFNNTTSFFLAGFLCGYLTDSIQKTGKRLEEKEQDLKRLETLHINMIESIASGIITTDLDGKILFANRAARELTGYGISELLRKRIDDLFEFLKGKITTDGSIRRGESYYIKKDGGRIYIGYSLYPLIDYGGRVSGLIMVFQDLTEIKELQQKVIISDKLATIGKLARGIAHEIRNPLASMSGCIQMLREREYLRVRDRKLMDIVLRETERLNRLITHFLLFAKPPPLKKEKVELKGIVEAPMEMLREDPNFSSEIKVRLNIPSDLRIYADPSQLSEVFWNLLRNSIDAMPEGGEIEVVAKERHEGRRGVEIYVSDTGCGIDADDLPYIFDPFFTKKEGGTGLGLTAVRSVVESHGGEIEVKSERGRGTTFRIFIPEN